MKKAVSICLFIFVFFYPIVSFTISLGLRIQALYDEEAQFRMGIEMERYEEDIPKAKAFYLKAIRQKHPDAANRLAVLLEKEGEINEAIKYHEQAVEWYSKSAREGFSPLPGFHPSQWKAYNENGYTMVVALPSPGAHSALALAEIYRKNYEDLLIIFSNERIKLYQKSDFWYKKAFDLQVPAVLIGASLYYDAKKTALQWFALALKESINIPFVHYKMGDCYKVLGEYYQAIASYRKAMRFESETERDYRFAALSAVKLGEIYHQGIPGKEISANSELAENFYEKAFQISRRGWQSVVERRLEGETRIDFDRQLKMRRNAAEQVGVAQHIARAYREVHSSHKNPVDLNLALHWLTIAYENRELSSKQYQQAVMGISSQIDTRVPVQSEPSEGSCEHALGA